MKIDYYLSEGNFAKSASLAPCAVWMCIAGLEESKAMFKSELEDASATFADAWGFQDILGVPRFDYPETGVMFTGLMAMTCDSDECVESYCHLDIS